MKMIVFNVCRARFRPGWVDHSPVYIIVLLLLLSIVALAAEGKISGKLTDAVNNDPIIGANVFLDGLPIGTASDIDGYFVIDNVPEGRYALIVSMIGYSEVRVEGVGVASGKSTRLEEIRLGEQLIAGAEVVVEARFIQNNEAAMLTQRQKADGISDGLSLETISRSGAGEAAEAMQQVTGASVVDGKYVFVRGLGDRYASTQLNGVELPSADPDRRSFQLDLIPASLLDNIVTTKTFTPDQPGNFSGGVVNLGMRSFPDALEVNFSSTVSWNSETTFNDNFLATPGGNITYFGGDKGNRQIPVAIKSYDENFPVEVTARSDADLANTLDQLSNSFTPVMSPQNSTAPVNHGYSLSIGNQVNLGNRPLGYFGSFTFGRDYSFYEDGIVQRWRLAGDVAENDSLNNQTDFADTRGDISIRMGAMGTLSYELYEGHNIQFNLFRTQTGTSTARYVNGAWAEQNVANFETRALLYQDRRLSSYQLQGEHRFDRILHGATIDWIGSSATTSQDEPDSRFFSNTYSERTVGGVDTIIYSISPSITTRPSRYFRDMTEDGRNLQLNVTLKLTDSDKLPARIKLGASYDEKDRRFNESLYQYWQGAGVRYTGDPEAFFSAANTGIIGFNETTSRYEFGNYVQESLGGFGGNYWGFQHVNAAYAMVDFPFFNRLRVIAGARLESTRMNVSNGQETGELTDEDWLPSLNLTYVASDNMNVRAAFGRTLARPNFREKAPYASFAFVNDYIFNGNTELQRTLINNYDVRWEWFMKPGEIVSVSGYYKDFKNPIERVIDLRFASEGALITYQNVDAAKVYGIEFELRKRLGFFSPILNKVMVGGNLSLIQSEISIPADELLFILGVDPNAEPTRRLQGQSPYLVNASLTYDDPLRGTVVSTNYNVFGPRMSEVGRGGTPNVFEQPRHMLNFNAAQRLFRMMTVKVSVKNILNQTYQFSQDFKGTEYLRERYSAGRSVSFGLNYNLN